MSNSVIKLKSINKEVVKPIKTKNVDNRPVLGASICPTCYSNMALIASTASGKTTAIFKILQKCAGKKTKIVAFVSTFFNDDNWDVIKKWAKTKKIELIGYTSIYEDGKDILQEYLDELKEKAKEREKKEDAEPQYITLEESVKDECLYFGEDEEDKEEKDKYQYPETIFIFDDLASEIRSKNYENLLKKSRHFRIFTITSSQCVKDISPAARAQIRIWLLFPRLSEERLQTIYDAISSDVPYERFLAMYKFATKDKYNFFYINHRDLDYRKNFNQQFDVK